MEDPNSARGRERVEWIVKVEVEVGAALRQMQCRNRDSSRE
jgi:hypothetical protein